MLGFLHKKADSVKLDLILGESGISPSDLPKEVKRELVDLVWRLAKTESTETGEALIVVSDRLVRDLGHAVVFIMLGGAGSERDLAIMFRMRRDSSNGLEEESLYLGAFYILLRNGLCAASVEMLV